MDWVYSVALSAKFSCDFLSPVPLDFKWRLLKNLETFRLKSHEYLIKIIYQQSNNVSRAKAFIIIDNYVFRCEYRKNILDCRSVRYHKWPIIHNIHDI